MPYHYRDLDEAQTSVDLEALRGRQLMKNEPASAVHAAGDRVLVHGHRILASIGLHGASRFQVPDVAGGGAVKQYPTADVSRVATRVVAVRLTPGHFLQASVIALPSGRTETANPLLGVGVYGVTKGDGMITVTATYTNPASSTVSQKVIIPVSNVTNNAQPSGPGAAWAHLHRRFTTLLKPFKEDLPGKLALWVDPVSVTLTITYTGSPRPVDVVVYESPYALEYEFTDGNSIAPMHAGNSGQSLGALDGPVPMVKRSATEVTGGTEVVTDAAARLAQEVGPVLMFVSAWDEASQSITATETDYKTVGSLTFVELYTGQASTFATSLAGLSVSSGANARRVQESEQTAVLRDVDNVVPVRCYIYGSMTAVGPTATVRFETSTYSIAEVVIPSGTGNAWRSAPGHLRCGLGAQDPTILQIRAKTSSVGVANFRWRYILVVFDNV